VAINATDVARTESFQFTQDNFDIMGSDLSKLPAAWAVATSSAFPVAFDPLRYKYYPGAAMESAVHETLARKDKRMLHPVKQSWARSLIDQGAFEGSGEVQIDQKNHRYIYLSDGGVVDNLGVTYFYDLFRTGAIRRRMEDGAIERLVLIIVDAGTDSPSDIEASSSTPGKLFVGLRSATSGVHTTTWLMTAVSQYVLLEAEPGIRMAYDKCEAVLREQCPQASVPERPAGSTVETYFIDVNFRRLQDRTERERLLAMPTSFALDEEDVDALIEAGRNLVREHPELRRLLRDLRHSK
jgi:NTE family protein